MQIQIIETRRGSPDGHTVTQYHAGETYEVPHTMGTQFIRNGWATEVETPAPTANESMNGFFGDMARAHADFNRIFRPQPTRGSAPQNPATLMAKGDL
jgi:hypothetical protein